MKILRHQIAAFMTTYFEGRDAELRAIESDSVMGAIASEMSRALAASGFTNSLDHEIVMAAYEWLASKSPYVAGMEIS